MYGITLYTVVRNYPLFLIFAIALTAAEAVGLDVGTATSLIAYGFVALYSHRMVLLGETHNWDTIMSAPEHGKPPILRFMLTYFGFSLVSSLAIVAVVAVLFFGMTTNFIVILCVSFAVYGCLLSIIGTIFPAAATGGDATIAAAIARGKLSFQKTMIRLFQGPIIVGAIGLLGVAALSLLLGDSILVDLFAYLAALLPAHMTAIVLSMAYSETEQGGALPG